MLLLAIFIFVISNLRHAFTSRANPIYVDAIRPIDVLNRLLKSMNGGNEGIYGEIASGVDERLDNCVILAAESIRGIPKLSYILLIQSLKTGWKQFLALCL